VGGRRRRTRRRTERWVKYLKEDRRGEANVEKGKSIAGKQGLLNSSFRQARPEPAAWPACTTVAWAL